MATKFTLRQLEYFVAVAEEGSIALASEKVGISSPSISSAISQLEQQLGLPLFVRQHAQGLTLSQTGQRILAQAHIILREANRLVKVSEEISGKVCGKLRVGCLVTFAQMVLSDIRRKFEDQHTDVDLFQIEANQAELFSGIRCSEIDVAVTYNLDIPTDLQFVTLIELPPYVLVGEDHPLSDRSELSISDLREHNMVLLDLPFSAEYFLSFFQDEDFKPNVSERTRDMAVMRSLVANGYGYSIANIRPLNDLSPDGKKLQFIPLVGDLRPMRMGLLMVPHAQKSVTIKTFVEHCKAMAEQGSLLAPKNVDV